MSHEPERRNAVKQMVCAGIVAVSLCTTAARPAEAWGGGILFGTAVGLTAGAVIGSALVHPYPVVVAPPYPYPPPYAYAPPYGYPPPYGYAPPFPAPYGYAYPPPGPYPVSGYAPYGYQAPPAYGAAHNPAPPAVPSCQSGQFFNTLTGNCDRR